LSETSIEEVFMKIVEEDEPDQIVTAHNHSYEHNEVGGPGQTGTAHNHSYEHNEVDGPGQIGTANNYSNEHYEAIDDSKLLAQPIVLTNESTEERNTDCPNRNLSKKEYFSVPLLLLLT
jgi:hypothetical protein